MASTTKSTFKSLEGTAGLVMLLALGSCGGETKYEADGDGGEAGYAGGSSGASREAAGTLNGASGSDRDVAGKAGQGEDGGTTSSLGGASGKGGSHRGGAAGEPDLIAGGGGESGGLEDPPAGSDGGGRGSKGGSTEDSEGGSSDGGTGEGGRDSSGGTGLAGGEAGQAEVAGTAGAIALGCGADTFDHDEDPDTPCHALTNCQPGQRVAEAPTPSSNRVCAGCATGTFSSSQNSPACTPWTTCQPGQFLSEAGTATSDTECPDCPANSYSSGTNATVCTDFSQCQPGTYVSAEPTAAADIECTSCPSETYSTGLNAESCQAWTACFPWNESEKTSGSSTSDRVCQAEPELAARQFGTDAYETATAIAIDQGGSILVGGYTKGALDEANAGTADAFLRKYDPSGAVIARDQFGTEAFDTIESVAVDADANVYVVGSTYGSLGGTTLGSDDIFLAKYDSAGALVRLLQFGSDKSDSGRAVAVDILGNVFVAGDTLGSIDGANAGGNDALLWKFDPDGNQLWVKQFGTSEYEYARAVAVDGSGDVFVAGTTVGTLVEGEEGRAYLRKYGSEGDVLWTHQFGTSGDDANAVCVDGNGHAYVAGATTGVVGETHYGGQDLALWKYDSVGNNVWAKQVGTTNNDLALSVFCGADGEVLASGYTVGSLAEPNLGGGDALVLSCDTATGDVLWVQQFGTAAFDGANGIALDGAGRVFVAGNTYGALPDQTSAGDSDAFVMLLE